MSDDPALKSIAHAKPNCFICKKIVDRWESICNPRNDTICIIVYCHGDTEKHVYSRDLFYYEYVSHGWAFVNKSIPKIWG